MKVAIKVGIFLAIMLAGGFLYFFQALNQSTVTPSPTPSPSPSPTPSPSPNPMLAVINPIRDLILATESSFYSYGYNASLFVRGKVLVWNMTENKEVTDVESLLPSELVAKSPEENITVFAIFKLGKFVEIYWPEKEIAGTNTLLTSDDSIDINRLTANWITSLPRRDFIPKLTLIADVRDLVLAANSTYQSQPDTASITVNGRVLVWDFYARDKEDMDVEKLLPQELLANSFNGNITLFAIVDQSEKVVGHYSNGGEAIKLYRDILVVKWPEKQVIGRHTVAGDEPPYTIIVIQGSTAGATGDITKPTAEWILSLLR